MSEEFHYIYTHDLRTSTLEDTIYEKAKLIHGSAIEDGKTSRNVAGSYEFYFNLYSDTSCNYYARKGETRKVILNFVKKFQYPNPITKLAYNQAVEDEIIFSPLKETLKLLYVGYLNEGQDSYITQQEITDFLFFNKAVAKERYPNYVKVYNQILSYRNTQLFPDSIIVDDDNKKRFFNDYQRKIREMLNILTKTGFVKAEGNSPSREYSLLKKNDLSLDDKAHLHDILMDNNFWEGNTTEDYIEFFDIAAPASQSSLLYNIDVDKKLDYPVQKIYFGSPGTGKSYQVTQFIKETYNNYGDSKEGHPFVFRLMVHPEYSYFDFIGSILPVSRVVNDQTEINYVFENGVFVQSLITALNNENYDVFLVLEEMSRGNIVAIFGELFQLLDRDLNGDSEYTVRNSNISAELKKAVKNWNFEEFYLPKNLHILGTVNTSDQNVFVMDTAFKRRFDFEYVSTDPVKVSNNNDAEYENKFELNIRKIDDDKFEKMDWNLFYPILNRFIVDKLELNEDKQIGQFFIKFKEIDKSTYNYNQIKNKLFQFLWNDIHLIKLTNSNLFSDELKSFGDLYKINIEEYGLESCFSQEFLNYLHPENPNGSH